LRDEQQRMAQELSELKTLVARMAHELGISIDNTAT